MSTNTEKLRLIFARLVAAEINIYAPVMEKIVTSTADEIYVINPPDKFSDISNELSKSGEVLQLLKRTITVDIDEKFGSNLAILNSLTLADEHKIKEYAEDFSRSFIFLLALARVGKNSQDFFEDFARKNINFDKVGIVLLLVSIIKLHSNVQTVALGTARKLVKFIHEIQFENNEFEEVKINVEVPYLVGYENDQIIFSRVCEYARELLELEVETDEITDIPINNTSSQEAINTDNGDLTLVNILLWMSRQENLTTSNLAKKISIAGIFPNALLSQINELSLDHFGELAVTEDRGEIIMRKSIILDVINIIK